MSEAARPEGVCGRLQEQLPAKGKMLQWVGSQQPRVLAEEGTCELVWKTEETWKGKAGRGEHPKWEEDRSKR